MKENPFSNLNIFLTKIINLPDDKVASECPEMYPVMRYDGALIECGTRINWNGVLKKAAVDLWDTEEDNPDNAPLLWADIQFKGGYRIIPTTLTVTTAFEKDECGWWDDVLYRSLLDANVYTPAVYPQGWEVVE